VSEHYRKARAIGRRQVRDDIAKGIYPYLPALDAMVDDIATLHELPVGLMEIRCELIMGTRTRGRQSVFSRSFMPLADSNSEFAEKWSALFQSQLDEGIRDPIKVYEYLQRFYVLEGNKRCSVLKFLHMPTIQAEVTRILPHRSDDLESRLYFEFLDFWRVCPLYGLFFSRPGSYGLLAQLLGRDLAHPWPEDEVRALRTFFGIFTEVAHSMTDDGQSFAEGDALLVYLKLFGASAVRELSPKRVEERLSSIWSELGVSLGESEVTFVEEPQRETSAATRVITGLVRNHQERTRQARPLRIAFLFEGNPETSGWTRSHDDGRRYLEKQMGDAVETLPFYDRGDQGRFDAAIDAAELDEDDLVITTSPRQMGMTLAAAVAHPQMEFLNCSINLTSARVRTLYSKMYEPKFILGAIAASAAENHHIGYLANHPLYGTLSEVNAFALGAQMVDPKARVHLRWSSLKGHDWHKEMLAEGARVISGQDYYDPRGTLRSFGVWAESAEGPRQLAYPLWGWGRCFELVSRYLIDDLWERGGSVRHQALNYWWGMDSGAVDIRLADDLPDSSRRLAQLLRRVIVEHVTSPFEGPIRTQEGLVGKDGACLTNTEIVGMRWLCENVEGRLPTYDELTDNGKAIVRVSGIIDAPLEAVPRRRPTGTST
jgi:hypothetical protein